MKAITSVTLLVLLAVALPGCAQFSAEGRSRRAYAKYVRQTKDAREKQRAKVRKTQAEVPPAPEPDPVETISVSPEGAPSDG